MGKRNIHILIEKFFENDLSPEIQKKFHAWLLDRNFQEEKEKAMVTLWEEKSAVANESTFQELSRLHKRIEASDRMLHKPIGLYIKRIAAILLLPLLGAFGTYYYLTKVNPVVEEAQLKECFVANGEQKQVKLPDGTKVWLNSGSLLVYDKHFRGKRRLLFLNGEARFQVAKDPTKPFFGQNRPYDGQSTRHRIQSKRLFRPGCYDCHVGRRENPSLSLFEARHKPDFIARRTNHLQSPPGNTGTQYCRRRTRDAMDRRVSDIPDGLVRPDRKDHRT